MNNKILIYFILIFLLFIKNKSYENFSSVNQDEFNTWRSKSGNQGKTEEEFLEFLRIEKLIKETVNKNVKISFPEIGSYNMASFPIGTILPFIKTTNVDFPTGWYECNGKNRTPDLKGRFLFGKGYGSNKIHDIFLSYYNRHDNNTDDILYDHLKIKSSNLPLHKHDGNTDNGGAHSHGGVTEMSGKNGNAAIWNNDSWFYSSLGGSTGETSHTHEFTTNETGEGKDFEAVPPYLAVIYIIKLF